jgi:hypothetical protein
LKSLDFLGHCFVACGTKKQLPVATKPFSVLAQISGNNRWLSGCQRNGGDRRHQTGDSQMRTISFILAFAFVLAGASMAGSADKGLPGIGTFAYHGSPVTVAASRPLVLAAK